MLTTHTTVYVTGLPGQVQGIEMMEIYIGCKDKSHTHLY